MWTKLIRRLTDPLFYRKRWLRLTRPLRPPRAPSCVTLTQLLKNEGPLIAIIAHPDDELFASCLLCELTTRHRPFHIVCMTRGEGGITGNETREELGKAREAELRTSATALGAASVTFLDHIDPLGKEHRTYAPNVSAPHLAAQISQLIERISPSMLITHGSGGEYWHPAHILLHRAVFLAAKGLLPILTIHAWQENHALPGLLNRDDPADLLVDGSVHREQRLNAFHAHRSQQDYFARHGGGSVEAYVEMTSMEGYRYFPASGSGC